MPLGKLWAEAVQEDLEDLTPQWGCKAQGSLGAAVRVHFAPASPLVISSLSGESEVRT